MLLTDINSPCPPRVFPQTFQETGLLTIKLCLWHLKRKRFELIFPDFCYHHEDYR